MNEQLKYNKENLFNSPILQQYDSEGQRYFLSYLLKKNYDFEIKSGILYLLISHLKYK